MWRNEGRGNWLHRVGESELSGAYPCSLSMDSALWLWGVHLVALRYMDLRNPSNCIHFWSRGVVIYRACGEKLRWPKRGQKLWTSLHSARLSPDFLEF